LHSFLFATLSVVNAVFGPCGPDAAGGAAPAAIKVVGDPSPPVPGEEITYTITDATGKEAAGKVMVSFGDAKTGKETGKSQTVAAKAGKATADVPKDLPKDYRNGVVVMDDAGKIVGCAVEDGTAADGGAKGKDGADGADDGAKAPKGADGADDGDGAKAPKGADGADDGPDGAKGPKTADGAGKAK